MPDETKSATPEPPILDAGTKLEPQVVVSGSDVTAILFGVPVFLVIVGAGVLNICAAMGWWNPLHWRGRFWTGVGLLAVPSAMVVMTTLPPRIRKKIPESVASITVILLWVTFFWAVCGGH